MNPFAVRRRSEALVREADQHAALAARMEGAIAIMTYDKALARIREAQRLEAELKARWCVIAASLIGFLSGALVLTAFL